MNLLELTESGFYCPAGDFYIDPWKPVNKALITHGHADHALWGSRHYLASQPSSYILRKRLGGPVELQTLKYGEEIKIKEVKVSFHPAGHILGSAQIRLEYHGEVWVISGDYKIESDPTCTPFEPQRCHTFITESTFALPVFCWKPDAEIFAEINRWWFQNKENGKVSLIFAYALGKAQRILAGIDPEIGPIYVHGSVDKMNECYREAGVSLTKTIHSGKVKDKKQLRGALVIAPPSANNAIWLRKFPKYSRAFASGWMQIRRNRLQSAVDRGFALSDHADWAGILQAVKDSGAENIWVTHGYIEVLVHWLQEHGYLALAMGNSRS
jgi:putative mRNA 3-end processing factor